MMAINLKELLTKLVDKRRIAKRNLTVDVNYFLIKSFDEVVKKLFQSNRK